MDRFTKTCLVLIVLLLGVIAVRPIFSPQPVKAAKYKEYSYYYIGQFRLDDMETTLPKMAANGFEVVGVTSINNQVLFILAR